MNVAAVVADQLLTPDAAPRGDRLTLEVRRDLEWSPADVAALDVLIDTRPEVGVFLSRAWLSGHLAEPPHGVEPFIALLREGGLLRGVLPLATRRTVTHTRVTLLGGGVGSDRVDLLAARGYETRCADLFLAWLEESFGSFVLELRDVPGDSPLWGAVCRAVTEGRSPLVIVPREVHVLPYLTLDDPPSEWPGGAASKAASTAKHRRSLERRCLLKIDVLQDVDDVMFAFGVLARLLRARWGGDASVLDIPRMSRFHHHVLPRLLREGRLRMIRLRADMRSIAVFYGLASAGGWWGYYLAGYDREWAGRLHLGRITLAAAIDLASQEGAREFDFLKGVERTKYHWPVRERVAVDADVYSCRPGAQLSRATSATRDAAAALLKSVRPHFW